MPDVDALQEGDSVGDFTATTIAGETVSREMLAEPTLVGFFPPGCQPCAAELPNFVEHAAVLQDGAGAVLAVVDADTAQATEYVEQLSPVARVVVERHGGPVQTAFAVSGYPTLCVIDGDGIVLAKQPWRRPAEQPSLPTHPQADTQCQPSDSSSSYSNST